MEDELPKIKLYGADHCHKTEFYRTILNDIGLPYQFLDITENSYYAEELRSLYENGQLNFPTLKIGKKKLRNPMLNELFKWLNKLIPDSNMVTHDKKNKRFIMAVDGGLAKVDYELKNGKMYLVHSEVPRHLRGKGIGKILVENTFQKLTEENYDAVTVCAYVKAVRNRSEKWKDIIG